MAITSKGYEGSVNYADWAILTSHLGAQYSVFGADAFRPTVGPGDREIRLGTGAAAGQGIYDVSNAVESVVGAPVSSGSRWDLVVLRRDWTEAVTTPVLIQGGSTRALPTSSDFKRDEGVLDDQPIALVRFAAGQTAAQEIIDLRVWHGDGGLFGVSDLVLQYLDRIGSQIRIGQVSWVRTINALGVPEWQRVAENSGRLLGVYPLSWIGMAPSGSQPGAGVVVFGNATQTIAVFNLPDPGVPYRVRMYAHGFWGREFDSNGSRIDFDMMVGATPIATWLPGPDEFTFSNWRSWSPPASQQVFSGAQQLGFRGRRIYGNPWGAVKPAESIVIAEVFSA